MAVITVHPGQLSGTLKAPPSKSIAHRAMICAALSEGGCSVSPIIDSKDMQATRQCLAALGIESTMEGDTIFFAPGKLQRKKGEPFNCIESGSTLRFMLPIVQALAHQGVFIGEGRLGSRPLTPYEAIWKRQGTSYTYQEGLEDGHLHLTIKGRLKAGDFTLPGNVSSQFISGLLLALPMLSGDSCLYIEPPLESEGYIQLTLATQEAYGIKILRLDEHTFFIQGNQTYKPRNMNVEGDYSQGAVLLCAGALGHQVTVQGLEMSSHQGDRQIISWLYQMGAQVKEDHDGTIVCPGDLHGITVDGRQCPDVLPILALTCALAKGESRIRNCGRLRMKECDRLAATVALLTALGADIHVEGDDMVICGVPAFKGGITLDCYNDHRMAMMLSIAALHCDKPLTLTGADCVKKSWPSYFDDFVSLGGVIS